MGTLADYLDKPEAASPAPAAPPAASTTTAPAFPVEHIEIEAVVCGALMRCRFGRGADPAAAVAYLKQCDANAKFREDFPSKGAFGKKDTKLCRAVGIRAEWKDQGAFISLMCKNGDDFEVIVSKRVAPEFLGNLKGLGKVSEANIAKLDKAAAGKGSALVFLSEEEQFGVGYWSTDDGKAFLDNMTPQPPTEQPKEVAAS